VAVDRTAYHFDKLFDYRIPPEFSGTAQAGCRVTVPFGGGNRRRQGMIMALETTSEYERIKPLTAVLDKAPLLSTEMLALAVWLRERTFCTYFDAVKAMLPVGITLKLTTVYSAAPALRETLEAGRLDEEEQALGEALLKSGAPLEREKLLDSCGLSADSKYLEKMLEAGLLIQDSDSVRRVSDATLRMVRLTEADPAELRLTRKQQSIYDLIEEAGSASVKELCYLGGVTESVVQALSEKGVAEYFEREVYRNPYWEGAVERKTEEILLTPEQQSVFDGLKEQMRRETAEAALLFGVTGSGKTSVYMKLIDETVEQGAGVIVMVPEISLTPQTLSLFRARYGDIVAVFHSALSLGERLDEWKRVKRGEARIAVGTRSAIFAPFEKIGLIVMDEEQEHTYKSEASPRYHARDVAKFRAMKHKALLLLCSATPAVESYKAAQSGIYSLYKLSGRYGPARMPEVSIIDLNSNLPLNRAGSVSEPLCTALRENRERGEQSILLLNRRGYHTFVSCRACGHVLTCPQCSISMTYHAANGRLMCHYCGYSLGLARICPECGEEKMRYSGAGTQRLEEELGGILPEARILRLDADTTISRFAHEEKLKLFEEKKYDIMIGTQMVAKGLDFPSVTLVGVLSADQALYSDDFRSYERAFSLLTQVVGRAGRGDRKGRAIVQTYTPENPVIRLAATQDYEAFYRSEIQIREALLYPPRADLCLIGFVGENHERTEQASLFFFALLREHMEKEYPDLPLRILRPMPAAVVKVSGKYRYKLTIKCKNTIRFRRCISELLVAFSGQKDYEEVIVFADINPE